MQRKLKLRISSIDEAEKRLLAQGAKFTGELDNEYIYFNQPPDKVLKIVINQNIQTVMESEKQDERFVVTSNEKIDNLAQVKRRLTREFGISKSVQNSQRLYRYQNFEITLNDVKGIGTFLTLVGRNPTIEIARKLSGLENPEIVEAAYDRL